MRTHSLKSESTTLFSTIVSSAEGKYLQSLALFSWQYSEISQKQFCRVDSGLYEFGVDATFAFLVATPCKLNP